MVEIWKQMGNINVLPGAVSCLPLSRAVTKNQRQINHDDWMCSLLREAAT
jgi:hypothetical protein